MRGVHFDPLPGLRVDPASGHAAGGEDERDPFVDVSSRREKLTQAFSCVEHARLHGVLRRPGNLGDLLDGLVMVVDEVDHIRGDPSKVASSTFG